MSKRSSMTHNEKYTADGVIGRGYEIYDEWRGNRLTSRGIVSYVDRILTQIRADRTGKTLTEGLACLFALDMRIGERYRTLLSCIFRYFAWRREVRILTLLKKALHIPLEESDVRTAIEIELKNLREQMAEGELDDADDETHGGKRNGKAEEEAVSATEQSKDERGAEETADEFSDVEENDEPIDEKADELSEQNLNEESIDDLGEQRELQDAPKQDENIPLKNEEKPPETKQDDKKVNSDNNGHDEASEPSIDKKVEAKTYNDAVDPPFPIYDDTPSEKPEKKLSYVDEVIMDNLARGKMDYVGQMNMDDVDVVDNEPKIEDKNIQRGEDGKKKEDDHLYDELINSNKDENSVENQNASKEKFGKTDPHGNHLENPDSAKKDFDDLRVPLHIDIENETNNERRREISNNMTERMVRRIYKQQAAAMREQLTVASAAHGIDAPVKIIGVPDSPSQNPPSIAPKGK